MAFELDVNLPPALAPLAWLVGRWEGAGVLGYPTIESAHFGQEVVCSHDGRPFLEWQSRTWLLDDAGEKVRPLAVELGFWRVLDSGEIELLLTHPSGIVEMYVGHRDPAKPVVNLRTDGVLRSPAAKEYNSGSRMYGLVESQLFWAMDMAAVGQHLQSHVSAQLKRVG
ncbi:MAG TPA: FABP family protein [Dermatophilaceae bacterium]|nr:FABP family protein [Dermatophilaceae bacterium]